MACGVQQQASALNNVHKCSYTLLFNTDMPFKKSSFSSIYNITRHHHAYSSVLTVLMYYTGYLTTLHKLVINRHIDN